MTELPGAISGISDPEKVRLMLFASGRMVHAPLWAMFRGRGPVVGPDGTELMVQTGYDASASGATITFSTPFSEVPEIFLTVNSNAPGRIQSAKYYDQSETDFKVEKTELISGSATVSTASFGVSWAAIGPR